MTVEGFWVVVCVLWKKFHFLGDFARLSVFLGFSHIPSFSSDVSDGTSASVEYWPVVSVLSTEGEGVVIEVLIHVGIFKGSFPDKSCDLCCDLLVASVGVVVDISVSPSWAGPALGLTNVGIESGSDGTAR